MKLDPAELFDLRMRRQNKPVTKQRETKYYGDPAKFIEFESERKRQAEQRSKNKERGRNGK